MLNVVLVDRGLSGHHLSFNRTFSKILLKQGCRVFLLVPGSPSVSHWIAAEVPDHASNFEPVDCKYDNVLPPISGAIGAWIVALRRWRSVASQIRRVEIEFQVNVDLVFFSWMDDHLARYIHPWLLDQIFRWKWSGLYFHPYHLRIQETFVTRRLSWRDIDSPFLSRRCLAVCMHDRAIAHSLEVKRYRRKVYAFAETADCSDPDSNNDFAQEVRTRAKDRIVVGMIGCEQHKGLLFALEIARNADQSRYFFVFAGLLPLDLFPQDLIDEWDYFSADQRENCYCKFGQIDEGIAYNSLFCSIDIHLLVYENFVSSSNRLTKAADLGRFVLTDNQYCIGDDVKNFRLGEAIQSKNLEEALDGLGRLRTRIIVGDYPWIQWKQYARLNGEEELEKTFCCLLGDVAARTL